MAFKLKTGKTVNKVLAGAGIVALATTVTSWLAPAYADSPAIKAVEGIVSYGVGGVESVIGAGATILLGSRMNRGAQALDNTRTETL
jgi:formylmethanofuran:tetrahydromethanopterin formyltransferase